ncbi:MAG: hypothetical protein RL150_700 [Candidatus Parcubacteria bacterium]|jgi:hypothetical protein
MSTQQEGEIAFIIPTGNISLEDGYELEGGTLFIILVKPDGEAFRIDLYVVGGSGIIQYLFANTYSAACMDALKNTKLTIRNHGGGTNDIRFVCTVPKNPDGSGKAQKRTTAWNPMNLIGVFKTKPGCHARDVPAAVAQAIREYEQSID